MKRVVLASLVVLSLAACRRQPEEPVVESSGDGATNAANAVELPEPDINASLETIGAMHPDEADYRFAGRWAANQRSCANQAWRITNSELRTPDGATCRFTDVRAVPGGYDVDASCRGEGDAMEDKLRIRFAESAGGMLIESERIAETGLVPCEEEEASE